MSGGIERIGWAVRLAFDDGDVRWTWPNTGGMWTEKRAVREADAWAEDGYDAKAMPLYAAPEGTIESLEAENRELRGVVEKYGDDPDYARSRFRQIDLMVDQRAHDRLKIDGLEKQVAALTDERDRLRSKLEHATNVRGSLEAERDELRATVERLEEALWAVYEVDECDSCPPDHSCGCALNRAREIARDALVPLQPTEGENGHE